MRPTARDDNHIRYITLAASIGVFILIILGGMLRVSGTGSTCPDWPTCFGTFAPPSGQAALLDYLHRASTVLTVVLIVAAGVRSWRRARRDTWVSYPIYVASVLMFIQIGLGAWLSLASTAVTPGWLTAIHLGLSLVTLSSLLLSTGVAFYQHFYIIGAGDTPHKSLRFRSSFARFSILTLVTYFTLLVSGAILANSPAASVCTSWPLCDGTWLPVDAVTAINLLHRVLVLGVAVLLGILFVKAWKSQRTQTTVLVSTTAAIVLFIAQALLGAKMLAGYPAYLLALHQATAVAVWAALVVQIVAVGVAGRTTEEERVDAGRDSW